MRCFLLALAIFAPISAHAEMGFVGAGQEGVFTATFVGCPEQADEDRFRKLVSDGDKLAAVRFADRSASCRRLTPGTHGIVENLSVMHGTSCLRPKGEPDCLWVPTDFVAKP